MKTELEENWLEEWNVSTLFPELLEVATSKPVDAFKEMKRNRKVNNSSLAEMVRRAYVGLAQPMVLLHICFGFGVPLR